MQLFHPPPSEETPGSPSGKTLSQCKLWKHKHTPKEFEGNNLASRFKQEAPTPLFHGFEEEYTQNILRNLHLMQYNFI